MKSLRYILIALVLLLPGCKDHQETVPDEVSEILGLKIDRPLQVAFASPQGETAGPEDYQSISVVFNQPMKALSAEKASIAEPFTIQPEAKGRFRWKGTATVSFEPEEPLKYATEYTVTVPQGLKAPGGNQLKEDYTFAFSTPGPRVVSSEPKTHAKNFKSGDFAYLQFDQAVAPEEVQKLLSYSSPSDAPSPKTRKVSAEELEKLNQDRDEKSSLESSHLVALELGALKPNTTYQLSLKEGLKGQQGSLVSKKPFHLTITTLGPLKWMDQKESGKHAPERGIPFVFNNRVNAKQLKSHLKVEPSVEIATSDYDEEDNSTHHHLYLSLEPNTAYTFSIDGKLADIHGQPLGKDLEFAWETGDLRPLVSVPEGISVLEANDTLTIPMGLRNIESITYRLAELEQTEVVGLLNQDDQNWLWGSKPFTPDSSFDVVKTFKPDAPANQLYTQTLNLREVLKGSKYGFVYYQVDLKTQSSTWRRRGLVQVTNLGATGKFSPENSVFFASSLDKGEALEGVEATVLDAKGRPVWRGQSDKDGQVAAPGWAELIGNKGADQYSSPQMFLLLKQGQDQVYVQSEGFGGVYTWQFGISQRWASTEHYPTAQVYSERGLYRPGEEVHLKGSLRDRESGNWVLPQVGKLKFLVKDSRDQKVDEGFVDLSEFGTFHHTVELTEKAPTGSYRVDYSFEDALAKEWAVSSRVTGATFRVEEFEAAQFEVNVKGQQEALVMGDKADFEVEANWLFGAPMVDTEVKWSARVEPAVYSSEDYPGFRFGPTYNPEDDTDDTKTIKEEESKTDDRGLFKSQIGLEGIPYKGDAELVVEGTVTSANRRSITGLTRIPVARGEYRIGLKPASTFLPSGKNVGIQVLSLTPDGKLVDGKNVKLELLRREWNSVKKSDVDGRFRWVTEVDDKLIQNLEHTTQAQPSESLVKPEEPGYYIVRATGNDGRNTIVSETSFYAHGGGYVPWDRGEGDTIELVPDKTKYAPGETAQILIKNPFPDEVTAFITYERDTILESKTVKLKGSAPVIEVPLTEEHLPNLYVSVMLFRGRVPATDPDDMEDIGKPAFKIGYVELPVSPESKRLKVSISTDQERYGPKDEVVTRLKVTDAEGNPVRAELSLTAADVGVLNLINFQTPDLFDTYYGGLPLAVKTSESRTDVIGQRSYGAKGENSGGGGGYNPAFRKDFKSTAVWEPQVVTNSQGEAEVSFELPENLTTFRIMATAITGDTRCGSADHEIINTKPLILKPSTPAFARLGDEFQAGVLAVNGTEKGSTVTITMEADGVETKDEQSREIFLKANEEREVLFQYTALQEGTATLRFSGKMADAEDGVQFEVPLQLSTQKVNLAQTGHLDDGELKQPIDVPQTAVAGSAELKIRLSSTILMGLESSVKSLLDYPYGCLEQRLSRVTPLLLADELVARMELEGWNEAKVTAQVQKSLNLMPTYAHSNGGLKVWPDSKWVHPLLTARAVSLAHLAKSKGYDIKGNWLNKARGYLKTYLDGKATQSLELSESSELMCQAAALEALTQYGFSGKAYLNKLMDKRSKMPTAGKALLLKAAYRLDQKDSTKILGQELMNSTKLENATAYFEVDESATPWLFSSDVGDTGTILDALMSTEQDFPMADKVVTWLLEARSENGDWRTTANNAAALSGLVSYSRRFEGEDPDFQVKASFAGKELGEASFSAKAVTQKWTKGLDPNTKPELELKKSGEGRLYYNLAVSYEDTQPSPAKDEGLTVLRSVTDLSGKPVSRFLGGEMYKVTLSVVAPDLRRYVVLRDPVPAGLSVVKTDFATESSQLRKLLERGSQPSWMTFMRFEEYSDRVVLFADALAPGEHTYQYLVRAQTPGTYLYPAAQAEEMYHPELFGRTGVRTIEVK